MKPLFNENIYFYPLDNEDKKQAYEYFLKAYEHQMKGDMDNAVGLYKKSLEAFPTAEAHTFLGWTYSFMGMYDEAIEECHKAIATDPDFGNPYNDIGAYYLEQGELDDAIPWLRMALKAQRYESYCFPHFNLGRVYEAKGQLEKALEHFQAALEENPRYSQAAKAVERVRLKLEARKTETIS